MTRTGFAVLFAVGAPAAPAPPPGVLPWDRDMPAVPPSSQPDITDPAPHGRRMARIQLSPGTEFRPILH